MRKCKVPLLGKNGVKTYGKTVGFYAKWLTVWGNCIIIMYVSVDRCDYVLTMSFRMGISY